MQTKIKKIITYVFYFLFFFVPIIVLPVTSELFEFNKLTLVYLATTSICTLWAIRMIAEKRIIFRRTMMDIPLALFLLAHVTSTYFSIDPFTSIFGYYSRFHGGLLSILCYTLLYWAYVSNLEKKITKTIIGLLTISALFVSSYAVLEHFGIDKNLWVQDVQNRVFSTLGQPNWLAAWVCAIIPLTWIKLLDLKPSLKEKKYWLGSAISAFFFLTLLYTKSRSGILGFIVSSIVFWPTIYVFKIKQNEFNKSEKSFLKTLIITNLVFFLLVLIVGTPWTPSLTKIVNSNKETARLTPQENFPKASTALETGGTESGKIRKIVWKGAIDVWKHYPLFGSGVETFAYSYYQFRPIEHNLISEWDFLYNKAHNEYLNFLATTGIVGLGAYLIIIVFAIFQMVKVKQISFLSGFTSILVSNFFGFSVVPVAILFFLFPAMAQVRTFQEPKENPKQKFSKTSLKQWFLIILVLLLGLYILFSISRYWYADVLYSKGKNLNDKGNYPEARLVLFRAVSFSPLQAVYFEELAHSATGLAISSAKAEDTQSTQKFAEMAISEMQRAVELSPRNLNILRSQASLYLKLAVLDPEMITSVVKTLEKATSLSPTDAKLFYNLGLSYARNNKQDKALTTLQKAVSLKSNFKDARIALGKLYAQIKDYQKAKEQFEYILQYISPGDITTKELLNEVSGKIK